MTPNKEQLIFDKIGSNKGIFPLLGIFIQKREIRNRVPKSDKNDSCAPIGPLFTTFLIIEKAL